MKSLWRKKEVEKPKSAASTIPSADCLRARKNAQLALNAIGLTPEAVHSMADPDGDGSLSPGEALASAALGIEQMRCKGEPPRKTPIKNN